MTIKESVLSENLHESSHVFLNIRQFKGMDEYEEERIMTSFKPRPVTEEDELFIVFLKINPSTIIFSLDEVYEKTKQYLVHAEDICEFIFSEKDKDLVWVAEPLLGKDLI